MWVLAKWEVVLRTQAVAVWRLKLWILVSYWHKW